MRDGTWHIIVTVTLNLLVVEFYVSTYGGMVTYLHIRRRASAAAVISST